MIKSIPVGWENDYRCHLLEHARTMCHFSARWPLYLLGLNEPEALNSRFPDCWIGRKGCILWPPRNTIWLLWTFFCWVTLRTLSTLGILDARHLNERITDAISTITPCYDQETTRLLIFLRRNHGQLLRWPCL